MTSSHRRTLLSLITATSLCLSVATPIAAADTNDSGSASEIFDSSAGSSDDSTHKPVVNEPKAPAKADDKPDAEQSFDPSITETQRLAHTLEKKVSAARSIYATDMPKAVTMRDKWGFDAAFEAINRLNEVKQATDDIDALLATAKKDPARAAESLRRARGLALYLDSKLSAANYDVKLAESIAKSTKKTEFKCANAIDDGDTAGSSWSSSTLGLFNSTGNRVVYDKDGHPQCTTNFEFYFKKIVKFVTTVLSIVSFVGTIVRLVSPRR